MKRLRAHCRSLSGQAEPQKNFCQEKSRDAPNWNCGRSPATRRFENHDQAESVLRGIAVRRLTKGGPMRFDLRDIETFVAEHKE